MDFKVKCVRVKKYPEYFTEGKVYDVVNGSIVADNGCNFNAWSDSRCGETHTNDFEGLKRWFEMWYDFELVEDKKVFTKSDLKNGDVIVRRNGNVGVVMVDLGVLIADDGWNDLDDINEDLTDCDTIVYDDEGYDIVKVYRPRSKYQCQFYSDAYTDGELIYDRERDTKPLYNGKVVCVDNRGHNEHHYTVGKIYEIKDGKVTTDDGLTFPPKPVQSFEEWQDWTNSKFIEIVE